LEQNFYTRNSGDSSGITSGVWTGDRHATGAHEGHSRVVQLTIAG